MPPLIRRCTRITKYLTNAVAFNRVNTVLASPWIKHKKIQKVVLSLNKDFPSFCSLITINWLGLLRELSSNLRNFLWEKYSKKNQSSIQTSNSTGLSTKGRMCLKPYVGTQTVLVSVLKQGFFVLHNKQRQQSVHCVLLRTEQRRLFEEFQVELVVLHHQQHKLSSHMAVLSCMNSIQNKLPSHMAVLSCMNSIQNKLPSHMAVLSCMNSTQYIIIHVHILQ